MLRVVLPVCRKDVAQMANVLRWAYELDGRVNHNCLISYETGTNVDEVRDLAGKYFQSVQELEYPEPPVKGWPAACNWAWTRAANWMVGHDDKTPWLWLEADSTPLVPVWLDTIEEEYINGKLPFMGCILSRQSKKPGVELDYHMNGVAVYPWDAAQHSGRAMRTRAAPWDIVLSDDCIGRMHHGNGVIQHVMRISGVVMTCKNPRVIRNMIDNGAVLFHGVNDGSIIRLLRVEKPIDPPDDSVVKELTMADLSGPFNETEALWQQEAIDQKELGFPFVSFKECVESNAPSFRDQRDWRTGIFHELEYTKTCVHLNPTIARTDSGVLWMVTRRWEKLSSGANPKTNWHSTLESRRLLCAGERVGVDPFEGNGIRLDFGTPPMIEHEDPRLMFYDGQFHLSYCTWEKQLRSAHGRQGLAVFDTKWSLISNQFPEYGKNKKNTEDDFQAIDDPTKAKWEKNWVWFRHKDKWHVVYGFHPFTVFQLGRMIAEPCYPSPKTWKYGVVRGGTPPVKRAGLFWSFFHSSVPWKGRQKQYHMGAYAFDEDFKIVKMTTEPLLSGSDRDLRKLGGPLVIFPGGAVIDGPDWLVVFGVNDEQCGWVRIPHLDLESLTTTCSYPSFT